MDNTRRRRFKGSISYCEMFDEDVPESQALVMVSSEKPTLGLAVGCFIISKSAQKLHPNF
jgi:hypothetical protein